MKRLLIAALIFLGAANIALAQTTVSGQVTDTPDSQSWNGGTYTFTTQALGVSPITGSLSASGAYSGVTIAHTAATALVGDVWTLKVCPAVPIPVAFCYTTSTPISGATQTVNATPPSIRINMLTTPAPITAYATGELTNVSIGSTFYLIGTGLWSCSAASAGSCSNWVSSSGLVIDAAIPGTCTPGTTVPIDLVIVGTNYGTFYCGGINLPANTWMPDNPNQTISPLSYGMRADVKYVYDALFTNASKTVTCPGSDCSFQCPGGSYPCTAASTGCTSGPGSSCDAGKIVFGTNSMQAAYPPISGGLILAQDVIATVNNANSITTTTNAASAGCTPAAPGPACVLVWGSADDSNAINAAATAAWSSPGVCRAIQFPNGASFFSKTILYVADTALSSACGGFVNNVTGSDTNQTGAEVFGPGPNQFVLIPLPSMAACTGGASGVDCIGGTSNMEAHDFGVNGFNQSPANIDNDVLFELPGMPLHGGDYYCTGSTGFNLTFANWGLQSTGSIGFKAGVQACGDATYTNIVSEMFGATNCSLTTGGTVVSFYNIACFGSDYITALIGPGGGNLNTYGSYFSGLLVSGPTISFNGSGIWNSYGDWINENQWALGYARLLQSAGCGKANFFGDNLLLNSGNTGVSMIFNLSAGPCEIHVKNSIVTATGAENMILTSASGDNIYDDGGNTFTNGSQANSISGAVFTAPAQGNQALLATGNLALSGGWGASAATSAWKGGNSPISFTITNGGSGVGASPTITYTFPTPYPLMAPLWCSATQIGGTNPSLAPYVAGTPSVTSVVFTATGTPTISDTEFMQVQCFMQ